MSVERRPEPPKRATVMNPYLTPLHDMKIQDMAHTFVEELAVAAGAGVRQIHS